MLSWVLRPIELTNYKEDAHKAQSTNVYNENIIIKFRLKNQKKVYVLEVLLWYIIVVLATLCLLAIYSASINKRTLNLIQQITLAYSNNYN